MKRALFVLPALLLLPVAIASAAASLPKPSDMTIVVAKSVAGIKIGMPATKARTAWGNRGKCEDFRCEYGDSAGTQGWANLEFRDGKKISAVAIYAGTSKTGKPTTTVSGALASITTKEGIGIGSKYSALKSAYKQGKLVGKPTDSIFYYEFGGKGKQAMTFSLVGGTKKVNAIFLSDGLGG